MLKCAGIERSLIVPVLLTLIFIVGCEPAARPKEYVSATELRLRAEPSQKGSTVEVLKFGAEVEVLSVSAESETINGITAPWKQVRYGDKEGWVFGGFLTDAVSEDRKIDLHEVFRNGESITFVYEDTGTMNGTCTAYSWRLHADGSVSAENLHCTGFECGYNISNGRWAIADDSLTITATGTTPPDCFGFSQKQLDYRFDSFRRKDVHIANHTHKSFEILGPEKAK